MKDHRAIGVQAASLHASYEFYFGSRKNQLTRKNLRTTILSQTKECQMFNKSTRSYFFRGLVAMHRGPLSWREARLMFKGATVAAITYRRNSQ